MLRLFKNITILCYSQGCKIINDEVIIQSIHIRYMIIRVFVLISDFSVSFIHISTVLKVYVYFSVTRKRFIFFIHQHTLLLSKNWIQNDYLILFLVRFKCDIWREWTRHVSGKSNLRVSTRTPSRVWHKRSAADKPLK